MLTLRPRPEPVYNLEVEGDHCYRVGQQGLLLHNAPSGPNPVPKAEGEREVAAHYRAFGVHTAQNVAYAEINVGAYHDELVGVSGSGSPSGILPTPTSRLFDTFDTPPGFYRGNDAEVKLREAIAKAIEPNAQKGQCSSTPAGSVRLYSHFTICPSCDDVVAAFRAMFPNVALSVSDGT